MALARLQDTADESEGAQPLPQANADVLAECRDIVLERLCAAIATALDGIDADLAGRFDEAISSEQVKLYTEAQRQLALIRPDIDRQFRSTFQRSFQQKAGAVAAGEDVYAADSGAVPELALVACEEVADEVAVRKLANQIGGACEAELAELKPRMAHLIGQPEMHAERDPFGPEAICQILKEVCWKIDSSRAVKMLLLEELGRKLAGEVCALYREINRHLVARQVLPRIRRSVRRSRSTGMAGSRVSAAGEAVGGRDGAAGEGDLLALLHRLLAARATPAAEAAAPSHGAAESAGATSSEFLGLLDRLQRGESDVTLGGEPLELPAHASGTENLLRALGRSAAGRRVGEFNAALIDVVATLFDYIFDDPRVPALMKGLIGRLQIPLLKLALIDRAFFSNRHHPARRLVNALAQSATDWEGEGAFGTGTALYRAAEALVVRIQTEFSDDTGLFELCLREFEEFLARTEREADAKSAEIAGQLENRERLEIASVMARESAAAHIGDGSLPESVRQFLAGAWVEVLTRAALAGGQDGALWRCALATMEDLVWSVAPKTGAEERRRLIRIIPSLLRGLREGLEDAQIDRAVQEEFFAGLVRLHAAAVKAGMGTGMPRPAAPAPRGEQAAVSAAQPGEKGQPDEKGQPAGCAQAGETARPGEAPELAGLTRGSWLNVRDEAGALRRVRLSWISPARTMYLFTNHQGERALALSRPELERRLAEGSAALARERPLFDRVVEDVLATLQTGSEA
ncbi:MAG: DUF1631 domain-containing protein [Rhodocyclaceae bacterium]